MLFNLDIEKMMKKVKYVYADPEIQALIKDNYLKIYKKIHKALMKLL